MTSLGRADLRNEPKLQLRNPRGHQNIKIRRGHSRLGAAAGGDHYGLKSNSFWESPSKISVLPEHPLAAIAYRINIFNRDLFASVVDGYPLPSSRASLPFHGAEVTPDTVARDFVRPMTHVRQLVAVGLS
jgi:hypothetical protein